MATFVVNSALMASQLQHDTLTFSLHTFSKANHEPGLAKCHILSLLHDLTTY